MSTTTIYATGVHKQKENYGCYGISVLKEKSRKTTDYTGQFDSNSKAETQLNILIHALELTTNDGDASEIQVFSDFSLIENITNGTIDERESNNWLKSNKKPVSHAELWSKIFDLVQKYDLTFTIADTNDKKMASITKKMQSVSRKKKNTKPLKQETKAETKPAEEKTPKAKPSPKKKAEKTQSVSPSVQETKLMKEISKPKAEPRVEPTPEQPKATPKMATADNQATIKISAELMEQSQALCDEIGVPVEVAVTMFLKEAIRKKGLSLDLKLGE